MTADRWTLTLAGLMGHPWPALPDLPGRRIEARDEPLTDEERDELLRDTTTTDAEAALALRLTRQRVGQLRRAMKESTA